MCNKSLIPNDILIKDEYGSIVDSINHIVSSDNVDNNSYFVYYNDLGMNVFSESEFHEYASNCKFYKLVDSEFNISDYIEEC